MHFVLGAKLSKLKWFSLVLLTASLVVCEIPRYEEVKASIHDPGESSPFVMGAFLTFIGTLRSFYGKLNPCPNRNVALTEKLP